MSSDLDAYPAPPAYRPVSGGAITALVLSIVLLVPALGGLWWVEVLPIVIAMLSWGGISSGQRSGAGLAISASIVAILGALGSFLFHRTMAKMFEESLTPFAKALADDDREVLSKWVVEGADAAERADLWKRRMDAAKAEAGAFHGELSFGDTWFGSFKDLVVPPGGAEEFEPKGDRTIGPGDAIWIRGKFEKGVVWLAITGKPDAERGDGAATVIEGFEHLGTGGSGKPRSIGDVRLFREKGSSGGAEKGP